MTLYTVDIHYPGALLYQLRKSLELRFFQISEVVIQMKGFCLDDGELAVYLLGFTKSWKNLFIDIQILSVVLAQSCAVILHL